MLRLPRPFLVPQLPQSCLELKEDSASRVWMAETLFASCLETKRVDWLAQEWPSCLPPGQKSGSEDGQGV